MRRALALVLAAACSSSADGVTPGADAHQAAADAPTGSLSFFITSANLDGGNLGGLPGADAHCATLAGAAGAGARRWRAYLSVSASGTQEAVNARDRIGGGPWLNARGEQVAAGVASFTGRTT